MKWLELQVRQSPDRFSESQAYQIFRELESNKWLYPVKMNRPRDYKETFPMTWSVMEAYKHDKMIVLYNHLTQLQKTNPQWYKTYKDLWRQYWDERDLVGYDGKWTLEDVVRVSAEVLPSKEPSKIADSLLTLKKQKESWQDIHIQENTPPPYPSELVLFSSDADKEQSLVSRKCTTPKNGTSVYPKGLSLRHRAVDLIIELYRAYKAYQNLDVMNKGTFDFFQRFYDTDWMQRSYEDQRAAQQVFYLLLKCHNHAEYHLPQAIPMLTAEAFQELSFVNQLPHLSTPAFFATAIRLNNLTEGLERSEPIALMKVRHEKEQQTHEDEEPIEHDLASLNALAATDGAIGLLLNKWSSRLSAKVLPFTYGVACANLNKTLRCLCFKELPQLERTHLVSSVKQLRAEQFLKQTITLEEMLHDACVLVMQMLSALSQLVDSFAFRHRSINEDNVWIHELPQETVVTDLKITQHLNVLLVPLWVDLSHSYAKASMKDKDYFVYSEQDGKLTSDGTCDLVQVLHFGASFLSLNVPDKDQEVMSMVDKYKRMFLLPMEKKGLHVNWSTLSTLQESDISISEYCELFQTWVWGVGKGEDDQVYNAKEVWDALGTEEVPQTLKRVVSAAPPSPAASAAPPSPAVPPRQPKIFRKPLSIVEEEKEEEEKEETNQETTQVLPINLLTQPLQPSEPSDFHSCALPAESVVETLYPEHFGDADMAAPKLIIARMNSKLISCTADDFSETNLKLALQHLHTPILRDNKAYNKFLRCYVQDAIRCALHPKFYQSDIYGVDYQLHVLGTKLNDFFVFEKLAEGAFGQVFTVSVKHQNKQLLPPFGVMKMLKPQLQSEEKHRLDFKGLLNEFAIGLLLNQLRDKVPCFLYTFGAFFCDKEPQEISPSSKKYKVCTKDNLTRSNLMMYIIHGNVPDSFEFSQSPLVSTSTSPQRLFGYLAYLVLSMTQGLVEANKLFVFNHNDLHYQNFLVQQLPQSQLFTFQSAKSVLTFNVNLCPVILDYGLSTVKYSYTNEKHTKVSVELSNYQYKAESAVNDVYHMMWFMCNRLMTFKQFTHADPVIQAFEKWCQKGYKNTNLTMKDSERPEYKTKRREFMTTNTGLRYVDVYSNLIDAYTNIYDSLSST